MVVNVAWPALRATDAEIGLEPSMKLTVPVGVAVVGEFALRVAVRVTLSPNAVGFGDTFRTAVAVPLSTAWGKAGELLPMTFASPE